MLQVSDIMGGRKFLCGGDQVWWHFLRHNRSCYPVGIFVFNFMCAGALAQQRRVAAGRGDSRSSDKLVSSPAPQKSAKGTRNGLGKVLDILA